MTPEEFIDIWPQAILAMCRTANGWEAVAFTFHAEAPRLSDALTLLHAQLQERTVAVLPPVPSGWRYVYDSTTNSWVPEGTKAGNLPPPFSVVRDWQNATPFLYIPRGAPQAPAPAPIVFGPWHSRMEGDVGLVETLSRMNLTTGAVGTIVQRWHHKENDAWVESSGWSVFLGNPLAGAKPDASGKCVWAEDMAVADAAARALGVTFQDPPQSTKAKRSKT